MAETALYNKKGFTLVEMLIAVMIITVSLLALLTSVEVSMRTNMDNELKATAIRLTNQTAEALLALSLSDADLSVGGHTRASGDAVQGGKGLPDPVQTVRGFRQTYPIQWTVVSVSANVVQVQITVSLTRNGSTISNSAVIYKHSTI